MRKFAVAAIPILLLVSCGIQLACNGGNATVPSELYDALYPPRGLDWSVGSEKIFLSWEAVPFAQGYKVYLSDDGVNFELYSGGTYVPSNSIIIADVKNSHAYFVGVSAVGTNGVETDISYPGGVPDAVPIIPIAVGKESELGVPPAAPKNLQGTAGNQTVHLNWDANTETDLKDYIVSYRLEGVSKFTALPPVTSNFFDQYNLTNGQKYFYQVQARDKEEYLSDYSNEVSLIPISLPPMPPTHFTATYVFAEGGVILNWDKPLTEPDIIKYRIIRYEVTDEVDPLLDTTIVTIGYPYTPDPYNPGKQLLVPPFTDRFIALGAKYQYELAAIDADLQIGSATLSNIVEIPE